MTDAQMILEQIDIIKLDISIWTSSKKLRAEDLLLVDGSKLPPEDLASLGTKKTIHPDKLKEFNRIKKEAERICLEAGTRFIGGFANPRAEVARITKELDDLSKKFYEERNLFLKNYTADTEAWIRAHAEFGEAIRRAIEPVETVASKLRFDYVVFRVTKPDPEQEATLERHTCSMSEQLFREIAQEANQIIDRSFVGKDSVTARVLNAFRRIRDKLDSLGFLDHRCMPVVDEIDAVLAKLPKSGPYNGIGFHSLFRLGLLLSDAEKIKRHGSGLLNPEAVAEPDIEPEEDNQVIHDSQDPQKQAELIQPEPETLVNVEDDDIPGFDDFLARFNSSKEDDAFTQEPSRPSAESNQIDQAISLIGDVLDSFVDDDQEAVRTNNQVANAAPEESFYKEDPDDIDDDDDSVKAVETAGDTDFWF